MLLSYRLLKLIPHPARALPPWKLSHVPGGRHTQQDFPLADIDLTIESSPALLRRLDAGQLDLALVTRDMRQPFAILRRERFVWAAAAEYGAWAEDAAAFIAG